jgi:hypothetical protein
VNEVDLLTFLRSHRWAIEATCSTTLAPQAAIIGIAVTDQLEIVFDTLASSRKADNLHAIVGAALVAGGPEGGPPWAVPLTKQRGI